MTVLRKENMNNAKILAVEEEIRPTDPALSTYHVPCMYEEIEDNSNGIPLFSILTFLFCFL